MTKLEELLEQLCPNGVEFKKVKEVYQRLKGTPITATKMKEIANDKGDIRIFAGGKTVINANLEDIPKANIINVPAVLVQSRGVIDVVYFDKPFTFKNEMWAYTTVNVTSVKYLYYVLKSNVEYFRTEAQGMGALPQISLRVTEELSIPVPPIEIQAEIVRILDNFTNLTAELTAELSARRNQFEYYKENLFQFTNQVDWIELSKVCTIKGRIGFRGYTKKDIVKKGEGAISLTPANIVNHSITYEKNTYISWSKYEESPEIMTYAGDIVFCKTGSTIGKTAIVRNLKEKATINPQMVVLKNIFCNFRYLFYVLTTVAFQKEVNRLKGLGSVPTISQKDLGAIKIPVPDIEEQKRIANILDRFDKLCNDISEGLPAEIEARQKQYEYYRDKLLSF